MTSSFEPERVDWFMHSHASLGNTLVGVWPTPIGVYVRSWRRDCNPVCVITFYPMWPYSRAVDTIAQYNGNNIEDTIQADVLTDFRRRRMKVAT